MRTTAICLALSAFFATPAKAEKAVDFSLRNINNQEVTLSDFEGSVVLVNFWATWCGPCKVELPHLQELHDEYSEKGLVVLTISTDDARSKSKVKPQVKASGYTFEVLLDTETEVIARYNPSKTLPYTFLVDTAGDVAMRHAGYNPGDEDAIRAKVEALLPMPTVEE